MVQALRSNPRWDILDYPGPTAGIMNELWKMSGAVDFPRRKVFDARLALTLRHHGVTEFATSNVKDFNGFAFARIWNPLTEA